MATDNNIPGAEKDPQDFQRFYGLLVSEWVTYTMIVIVVAATIFGFKVGGERDAQAERAMATLDALTEEAERITAGGRSLVCDDTLLDADLLANDYLTLSIRPAPIDEDDESQGFGPALYVDVVEDEVSGDTWDTAKRLMALVKEAGREEAEAGEEADAGEGASRSSPDDDAEADEADDEDGKGPKSRLRNVRKTGFLEKKEYLSYYILASETATCSEDT
ncbi:MAG: hypothetical protein V2J24_03240 [Pseudomonadales bacterium]|nr:hypothetical protein [Pseudomonadales bacterium]